MKKATIFLLALLLTACGEPVPQDRITDKWVKALSVSVICTPQDGTSPPQCLSTTHPDTYWVRISNKRNVKIDDPNEWDSYNIGDLWEETP